MANLPTEHPHLVPYLTVEGAAQAIAFYVEALGATELYRLTDKDGRVGHAEIDFGTGRLMVSDAYPEYGALPPASPTGVVLAFYVADVDQVFAAALSLGATSIMPPKDQFYGDRVGRLRDPFGHTWTLHQKLRDVTAQEMQEMFAAMG